MTKSREEILARLRRATPEGACVEPPSFSDEMLFRDYPTSDVDLLDLFVERLVALKGEAFRVGDEKGAAAVLVDLLGPVADGPVLAQSDPLVDSVLAQRRELSERVERQSTLEVDSQTFAAYAAGISSADFLVARTGSILMRSCRCGGRRLTALPPTHIVLARAKQLVPSLADALAGLKEDAGWSFATVVTGPSRTADIEKVLVLGAHGPKRLVALVIES
jgi:L-lactate utilization protein LutC